MQVIGFVFLILGTFVYNDLVVTTQMRKLGWLKPQVSGKEEPLRAGSRTKKKKPFAHRVSPPPLLCPTSP